MKPIKLRSYIMCSHHII